MLVYQRVGIGAIAIYPLWLFRPFRALNADPTSARIGYADRLGLWCTSWVAWWRPRIVEKPLCVEGYVFQ